MEIKNAADLKAAIQELEDRKLIEKDKLIRNYHSFSESLKPINLLKSSFAKVKESPGIQSNVLKATLGLGVGLLSKRFLLGSKSAGIVKKMLGSAVEMGVAGLVAKNSDSIRSTGVRILKNLFGKKRS